MASTEGEVRQRILPPHDAGVAPATFDAASPIGAFIAQGVFVGRLPPPPPPPPPSSSPPPQSPPSSAPAEQQRVQETGASQHWLEGPLRDCAKRAGDDGTLARSLLDAGASTDAVDRAGRSPLHWACSRGNTAVVTALLDAGANGAARDGAGKTPLHCAAQVGHTQVVLALLGHYGLAPQGDAAGVPAMVAAAPIVVDEAGSPSAAAAAAAVQHDDGDISMSVVDARNAYGSTALHRAAFNGRDGVVVALLMGGAGVGVVGKSGRSALHLACHNAHAGCVGILLAWGADESATALDGSTPWSELALAAEERPLGCPRVAKTALLLNAARCSRAWGRRGWLLMLRHRHYRQTIGVDLKSEKASGGWGEGGTAVGSRNGMEVCEAGGGRGEEEKEEEGLAELVDHLLNVGEEGCFRLVVRFL